MNPESLSDRRCEACGTRIEWGHVHKDFWRHYCREGPCRCKGREWYALRRAGEWTHHSYREERYGH